MKRIELKPVGLKQRWIEYVVRIEEDNVIKEMEITLPRQGRAINQFKRLLIALGCELKTNNPYAMPDPEA